MKERFVGLAICLFSLIACLSQNAHACSCFPFSSGTEYLNSNGVYKGRLVRQEPGESHSINYYFEISHTYKGEKLKTLKLVYRDTDCRERFEVGGDYLIYAEGREPQRYCNRTGLISYFKEDLEHLDRFETEKPLLTIWGFISGVPDDMIRRVRVKIRSRDGEREVGIDGDNQFKQIVDKKQVYTVVVTLPLAAEIEMEDGNLRFHHSTQINSATKEMSVEYEVDLTKTFADARTIRVGGPIGSIGGRSPL